MLPNFSHKTVLILALFCVLGAFPLNALKSDAPLKGHYQTNFGPLKLFPEKDGEWVGVYNYRGLPAHLYLNRGKSGFYEAIWIQGVSEERCAKKQAGSPYWGRARVTFTGKKILIIWSYCDRPIKDAPKFHWTGDHTD